MIGGMMSGNYMRNLHITYTRKIPQENDTMRIIGSSATPVHDFYDCIGAQYGTERFGNVFLRHPISFESVADLPESLRFLADVPSIDCCVRHGRDRTEYDMKFFNVIVAGVRHGGIRIGYVDPKKRNSPQTEWVRPPFFSDVVHIYSIAEFMNFIENKGISLHKIHGHLVPWWRRDSDATIENIRNHLDTDIHNTYMQHCIDNKIVIVCIIPSGNRRGIFRFDINGELGGPLQFYKKLDAYSMWQELSMYVDGRLASPGNTTIDIPDIYRIEGHGFDKKTSFRKGPTKSTTKRKKQ